MASGGYPGKYVTGLPIRGIEDAEATKALIFQAGTRQTPEGLVTSGGRVLGVTALANSIREARDAAYAAVDKIHFDGQFFRKDIGLKSI